MHEKWLPLFVKQTRLTENPSRFKFRGFRKSGPTFLADTKKARDAGLLHCLANSRSANAAQEAFDIGGNRGGVAGDGLRGLIDGFHNLARAVRLAVHVGDVFRNLA